jgi:hypothetical protein
MTDLQQIFEAIKPLLQRYRPPLVPKTDTERYFDLWSYKDLEIEGRKRKEVFFAGLVIQKSYVGFYFMPVYAEPEVKAFFPPEVMKLLKGKSCFHIKSLTPQLLGQLDSVLRTGFDLYRRRGWV